MAGLNEWSATASSNASVGSVNWTEGQNASTVNNSARQLMADVADVVQGTGAVYDTWTFCDPADTTKKFRFDGGSVSAGATIVVTIPNADLSFSSFATTLLDDTSAGAARSTLGLVIGTDVQAPGSVPPTPGGRLTLTTAVPVTTSDVTGATTIYYTPHVHDRIELYDGSGWVVSQFTELSQATTDSTKSPAAATTNSNYDLFVWNDSGTLRCTRGPAWSSATARGTGAGTTELELVNGRLVNKVAITNGPAAQRGRYVGTVRTDASSQCNDSLTLRHVYNAFNRKPRAMSRLEGTDSWSYTTATWRQANNSTANQLSVVIGLSEDAVRVTAAGATLNSTSTQRSPYTGVGLDSTTVTTGVVSPGACTNGGFAGTLGIYEGYPGLGYHYFAWMERGDGSDAQTWYGDNAGANVQSGIFGEVLA